MGKRDLEHDFYKSMAVSHAAASLPLWREVYEKAFPNMVGMHDLREDGAHQRAGIDRMIVFANAEHVYIDEKFRPDPYYDIFLEYLSKEETGEPGWVCKPLRCNYIAYAVGPLGRCYLLPTIQLQQAWLHNSEEWTRRYGVRRARNRTNGRAWTTCGVCVPVAPLFQAIGNCLRLTFTPPHLTEQDRAISPDLAIAEGCQEDLFK